MAPDHDGLRVPVSTHYVRKALTVFDNKPIPIYNEHKEAFPITVSWTADVHVYPTGAYLDTSNDENSKGNISIWKKRGEVHVVVVHRGLIKQPNPFWPKDYILTTKILNHGARARMQLPPNDSGVTKDDITTYTTEWSHKMEMWDREEAKEYVPQIKKTFTRIKKCVQESSYDGNETEIKLILDARTLGLTKKDPSLKKCGAVVHGDGPRAQPSRYVSGPTLVPPLNTAQKYEEKLLFELPGPAHPIPIPDPSASTTTLYLSIAVPPTPAPSPRPSPVIPHPLSSIPSPQNPTPAAALAAFTALAPAARAPFLAALLFSAELRAAAAHARLPRRPPGRARAARARLRRRAARAVKGCACAAGGARSWARACGAGCVRSGGSTWTRVRMGRGRGMGGRRRGQEEEPLEALEHLAAYPLDPALQWLAHRARSTSPTAPAPPARPAPFSWKAHFAREYNTLMNWRTRGTLLRTHRLPAPPSDAPAPAAEPTCLALSPAWILVGLASARVHVFAARSGVLARTLVGHTMGVWCVALIDAGEGGRARAVSGACDKTVRVWDVRSGHCLHVLRGHTATVRCLAALPPPSHPATAAPPYVVSGGREGTLRLWDVRAGAGAGVLRGHADSVRSVVAARAPAGGVVVVSGSYDATVRVWDVVQVGEGGVGAGDMGQGEVGDSEEGAGRCRWVLRGHQQQVYVVACDGTYVASGGLDATVRVWSVESGECLAVLTGHTSLITALAFLPPSPTPSDAVLTSGAADGRVLAHALPSLRPLYRLAAHDGAVTALAPGPHGLLATGGGDGRARLFGARSGDYVRELAERGDGGAGAGVGVGVGRAGCVVLGKRAGRAVVEVWGFGPREGGA
ncbi:hypothetical protein HWV62_36338 [Athelia sp. TMB]|nr:hypothetical protein HWV62_36338 [Athelia sp. TMB]